MTARADQTDLIISGWLKAWREGRVEYRQLDLARAKQTRNAFYRVMVKIKEGPLTDLRLAREACQSRIETRDDGSIWFILEARSEATGLFDASLEAGIDLADIEEARRLRRELTGETAPQSREDRAVSEMEEELKLTAKVAAGLPPVKNPFY